MDCRCITPLRKWIDPKATFVTQLGTNRDICQWLIISEPQNPIFLKAAKKTLQNSKQNNSKSKYCGFEFIKNKLVIRENAPLIEFSHEILGLSGPPVLQAAAEECFIEGSITDILLFSQIVCVSDAAISCQMNGHVIHDAGNVEYKNSLKQLKLTHYNTLGERTKRKITSLFKH